MKKVLNITLILFILLCPIKLKAESNDQASNEITSETWLMGGGILAAGFATYFFNKLGKKIALKDNKKKKSN